MISSLLILIFDILLWYNGKKNIQKKQAKVSKFLVTDDISPEPTRVLLVRRRNLGR